MSDVRPAAGDFTGQARHYARARPGYPDALLDGLMRQLDVRPGALAVERFMKIISELQRMVGRAEPGEFEVRYVCRAWSVHRH